MLDVVSRFSGKGQSNIEDMISEIDAFSCDRHPSGQKNATCSRKLLLNIDLLYCPVGMIHFPTTDIQLKC